MPFLATWGCATIFFKDSTKIQKGRQRSTPKNFVGAKISQELFKFYYHISLDIEMCM